MLLDVGLRLKSGLNRWGIRIESYEGCVMKKFSANIISLEIQSVIYSVMNGQIKKYCKCYR